MATTRIQSFSGDIVVEGQFTVGGVSNAYVPTGGVALWYGSLASIPTGWALCNGTNGTPNLMNRMVLGSGLSYNTGQTGGNTSVTLTNSLIPSHQHPASLSAVFQSHNHKLPNGHYPFSYGWRTGGGDAGFWSPVGRGVNNSSQNHGHGYQVGATGSGQGFVTLPPYHALAYIMKL